MATNVDSSSREIVIEPRSGWRPVELAELHHDRDLLRDLTWRVIQGRYARSALVGGRVRLGARQALERSTPAVILDWHPIHCRNTGDRRTEHFEALAGGGHRDFIRFNDFSQFSHFTRGYDADSVAAMAASCLDERLTSFRDWHYDVVVLHEDRPLPLPRMAGLIFAGHRRSPHCSSSGRADPG